jgi:ABC-2 type transport system permease protein
MSEAKATIHDLGYQRYQGTRLAQARRFLVIARQVVRSAWRQRWGVKLPVVLAAMTVMGSAVFMFAMRHKFAEMVRSRGVPLPLPDQIIVMSGSFFEILAFVLAITVGCGTIADDLRAGAFHFYFARPLRPRDYVAGKLLGLCAVVAIPMLGGPFLLALIRLALADSSAELLRALPVVPRAIAYGAVGTLLYALPAAGLGALVGRRMPAQAAYAAYYIVVGGIVAGLAHALHAPALRAFALGADLEAVGRALFAVDAQPNTPPVLVAAAATAAFTLLGALAVWQRVRHAEAAGPGGAS